ncbi:RHS repeat-associated core domain-containing protein [Lacihabitans lacunae]|uniref:RHS repeat-associated core domain-containing protein n=1 Tax=Lacihabitans lacunae TaxID=1028214 RepID=A0ABV7Z104_9BACT
MRYFLPAFVFLFVSVFSVDAQTTVPGDNFGYTSGSFQVNEAGAATYNIPFVIPPGTAGLQPSIGISYSSQGGNSFVGLGWTLNGLSTITRSSKTRAQDETASTTQRTKAVNTGIHFDKSDRFSLDGERLVLAPSSVNTTIPFDDNYGDDQTIYYTEQNNFTKVILYENSGTNSPQYFKAYTKSGLIFYYGNTTDSRMVDPDKNVGYQWLVNKIEDRNGNYMTFSYDQNATSGEVYPNEIKYTGNSNTGLATYNTIQFEFENRPAADVKEVYGIRFNKKNTYNKRLKSVKILYQTQLVREYKLSYILQQYSLLERVQECDGSTSQNCFEPTVFEWSNIETPQETEVEVTSVPASSLDKRLFGDFNGDGLNDILVWTRNNTTLTFKFYANDGNGEFVPADTVTANIGVSYDPRVSIGEFNGDNVNDITVSWVPVNGTANDVLFLISEPASMVEGQSYEYRTQYYTKLTRLGAKPYDDFIIDINQDGISDFLDMETVGNNKVPTINTVWMAQTLPVNSTTSQVFYNALDQTALNNSNYNLGWASSDTSQVQFSDIENDGLTDIFIFDKVNGLYSLVTPRSVRTATDLTKRENQFQVKVDESDRNILNSSILIGTNKTINLLDMNADGLPDLVVLDPSTSKLIIVPNKGYRKFETQSVNYKEIAFTNFTNYPELFPNDFNADGLMDLTFYNKTTGANRTYLNNGKFAFNITNVITDAFPLFQFKDFGANVAKPVYGHFLNGSHLDLLYYNTTDSKWYVQKLRQNQGFTIKRFTNGAGLKHEVTFDNLLNDQLYEKAGLVTFPNIDIQAPLYVVSKASTYAGGGNEIATQKYRYCGATINVEGRGFRGFTMIMEIDSVTGIYDKRYFRQGDDQWKYTGQTVIKTERFTSNGILLSRSSHAPSLLKFPNNNYAKSFFSYAASDSTEDFVNYRTQASKQTMDNYGNPLTIVASSGNGFKDSTANVYTDDYTSWILGRLTSATVTHFAPNVSSETRKAIFEYSSTTGQLTKETSDANLPAIDRVIKTYVYDTYGNILTSTTNAWNGTAYEDRIVQTQFDNLTNRFVTQGTNPLGHISSAVYEQKFGVPLQETDINGLTTTYEYDGYSRLIKETMPDNTWHTVAYRKANNSFFNSPTGGVFLTYNQSSNGQIGIEHYDAYNRAIESKSKGFDGTWVKVTHEFLRKSTPEFRETIRDSYPYFEGDTPAGFTQREVNKLGQVVEQKVSKTGGLRSAKSEFAGLIHEEYNFKNQKRTAIYDQAGRVTEARYNEANNLFFTYDAMGRLLTTTDVKGNVISNVYNTRGLKVSMTDPDMGTYQYEYNGFGELTKQTYPNGDVVTMTYDKLGRLKVRTDVDGTTTNTYDTGNKAKGSLTAVSSYVSSHSFTFDNLGRKSQENLTLNGTTYTTAYTYDTQGRINTISYPANNLVLKYIYNSYGYLAELRNNANNSLFWKAESIDASGNVTLQTFGNGVKTEQEYEAATQYLRSIRSFNGSQDLQHFTYQFNDLAHLSSQKDEMRNNTESFEYDDYNRLVETKLNNTTTTTLEYDVLGNIIYKSDVGQYEYGGVNNGPHRLINVRTKDANVTCSFTLNINTTYTSFNKVKTISNDTSSVQVFYGPDQQRIMQKMYVNGNLIRTKLYLGGLVEIEAFTNGKILQTSFIGGVGIQLKETIGATTTTILKYYLKDHLGSVTGLTDAAGALVEEFSYDAWGLRRNADWTAASTSANSSHDRGFTGHEHYDLFAMIDMNGRVYDPVLGRFLQPDPFISDQFDLQAYNRYSYVLNNPLSLTDPSGYWPKFIDNFFESVGNIFNSVVNFAKENWKPLLVAAVGIGVAIFAGPAIAAYFGGNTFGAVMAGAAAGFTSSVTGSLLNGGGLNDALKSGLKGALIGGLSAGLAYNVGQLAGHGNFANSDWSKKAEILRIKIVGHGVTQGIVAEASGGKFIHGFISGAVAGGTEDAIGSYFKSFSKSIVAASIVGGVTSELTGGNFQNGAITGAFVMAYNYWGESTVNYLKEEVIKKGITDGTKTAVKLLSKNHRTVSLATNDLPPVIDLLFDIQSYVLSGIEIGVNEYYGNYNIANAAKEKLIFQVGLQYNPTIPTYKKVILMEVFNKTVDLKYNIK